MLTCRWYTKSFANPCESRKVFLSNFIVFCLPKSQWIKRYKQSNHTYQDFPKRFCDPRKIRPSISWLNYTSLQSTIHCHGLYILQFEVEKKTPTTTLRVMSVVITFWLILFPRPPATLGPPFHPSRLLAQVHPRLFQSTSGHESRK